MPVVTEAVGKAWRLRGGLATGWPVLAWVAKFKPDPLRRLHLDRLGVGRRRKEIDPVRGRAYVVAGDLRGPEGAGGHRAADLADQAAAGLTRGWADAIRRAARSAEDALPDRVDRAIATTDLDLARHRRWWQLVRVLQWLLVAAVVAGLGWLGLAFVLAYSAAAAAARGALVGAAGADGAGVGGVLAGLLLAGLAGSGWRWAPGGVRRGRGKRCVRPSRR